MYKVNLCLGSPEYEWQGFIKRDPASQRSNHNTWNGWESPVYMNRKQVEAFIEGQKQLKLSGACVDDWSMEGDIITVTTELKNLIEMGCREQYDDEENACNMWEVSFGYCWELSYSEVKLRKQVREKMNDLYEFIQSQFEPGLSGDNTPFYGRKTMGYDDDDLEKLIIEFFLGYLKYEKEYEKEYGI